MSVEEEADECVIVGNRVSLAVLPALLVVLPSETKMSTSSSSLKRKCSVSTRSTSRYWSGKVLTHIKDTAEDDNSQLQTRSLRSKSKRENIHHPSRSDADTVTPTETATSSPAPGNSKMTILPSSELQLLRDELIVAAQNNDILRDHNLQLVEENKNLANALSEEQKVVAMLHEAGMEWVRIEAQLMAESDTAAADINELVRQVEANRIGNAPLVNRITGLEVTNDALNARIRGLENEVKELKEERERRQSDYPPL